MNVTFFENHFTNASAESLIANINLFRANRRDIRDNLHLVQIVKTISLILSTHQKMYLIHKNPQYLLEILRVSNYRTETDCSLPLELSCSPRITETEYQYSVPSATSASVNRVVSEETVPINAGLSCPRCLL